MHITQGECDASGEGLASCTAAIPWRRDGGPGHCCQSCRATEVPGPARTGAARRAQGGCAAAASLIVPCRWSCPRAGTSPRQGPSPRGPSATSVARTSRLSYLTSSLNHTQDWQEACLTGCYSLNAFLLRDRMWPWGLQDDVAMPGAVGTCRHESSDAHRLDGCHSLRSR